MTLHHCECDPHGDNAKCDRPCARSAEERKREAEALIAEARKVNEQRKGQVETNG